MKFIIINVLFVVLILSGCKKRSIDEDNGASGNENSITCVSNEKCIQRFYYGDEYIIHYTNQEINANNSNLQTMDNLVLVFHGLGYDFESQYDAVKSALMSAGKYNNTLLLSVLLPNQNNAAANQFFWENANWKSGYKSVSNSSVSSFTIIDDLIKNNIIPKCPALNNILIMGHSAGGQFSDRYACLSDLESTGKNIDYIVSNPSSYVYIRPERWSTTTLNFTIPTGCGSYNNYRYGIENINNGYNSALTSSWIQNNFPSKNVMYLLGGNDLGVADNSCSANLMGSSRLERGNLMFDFMLNFYPNTAHRKTIVPGVGHDHTAMFNSPECVQYLAATLN